MMQREQVAARGDDLPEGDERAPPGTRTMALLRWAIVALMAALAAGSWIYLAADSGGTGDETRWHCPMHPRIATAHRGECPICGMDLVPVAAGAGLAAAPRAAPAEGPFLCPMHPSVGSADAEARCPECGMKLWERDRALAWAARHEPLPDPHDGAGVPGLAAVEIAADRVQLSGMRTSVATREPLAPTIRTAGFVAASETAVVSVTTRFAGWVETLGTAQTGQLVRKGDVLATLYSPDLASVQQAYLNALRWTEGPTVTGRPSSVTDLERDARARLEQLGVSPEDVALLASTGKPLREVSVRAPARGHITRRTAVRGLYVAPGTELFQIADLGTVWVLADVYESEIGRVRVGQAAAFETSAWPGERFTGRVAFVSPALNTSTRTLQARLELRNGGLKLRPGMYGEVALELGATEAVVIPREALVDTGDAQYVFVARDGGRFEPRRVRAGWSGDDKVAILEGLAAGERVVTTATFLVDSESRLRAAIEGFGGQGAAPSR